MRNIINQEELGPFLEKLKLRHPRQATFISHQVRSYILKKENTFLLKDENLGVSLGIKCLLRTASVKERKMFKNHGVWGNYLRLNLSKECFKKYSRLIDFAAEINKNKLEHTSFEDIIIKYRNRPAKKRLKLATLVQGRDFKYLTNINNYFILELLTEEAYLKEGQAMRNCLGTYNIIPMPNKKMLSVRNYKNKPIMTIHVDSIRKSVIEAKGVANIPPNQEILSLVCKNLELKLYPRRISELESNLISEILGQLIIVSLFVLPSLVVLYIVMGIIFR